MGELQLRFHAAAAREADAASSWYRDRDPRAADAFDSELEHAVARVLEAPHRWPRYAGETRRYLFRKFPFNLIYRVEPSGIQVIAVAHQRRKPGYWMSRLSS